MKCPLHNPIVSDDQTGPYESFLANVCQFQALNVLPTPILFEAVETAATFAKHNASWHKSCYLKYNNSKLAKAKKRNACNLKGNGDKGCEEGSQHQVLTFDADTSIRAIVTELQDTHLLAKVSDIGDLIAKEAKYKYHLKCLEKLIQKLCQKVQPANTRH